MAQARIGLKHTNNIKIKDMSIKIYYNGVLAEKTGKYDELIDKSGSKSSVLEFIMEMNPALRELSFVVSLNGVIKHGEAEIKEGDEISLIPPAPDG